MDRLALDGGSPVRRKSFPAWPRGGHEEKRWLERVVAGNRWFAGLQGDDPEALGTLFGERFARLHGARYGLPVSNGSVAIEVGLLALGVQPGDEVIVPAYTFISTATSVLRVGAIPVFADMDRESYCLDPEDAARRITPRTRAIIPVHLGGHMADMPSLCRIAEQHGLAILEDCAQAIDAHLHGRKAGTWGALGSFSFQSNKTLTCGEGGLLLTSDPELAERVIALRAFGRFRNTQGVRSSDLTCERLSTNHRLSEFQAAVLLGQLERFPQEDERRQANAARLTEALSAIPGLKHVRGRDHDMKHGYYYYLLRYEPERFGRLSPERMCEILNAEGIPVVPGDRKPIYRHPVFEPQNLAGALCAEVLERYSEVVDLGRPRCPATEEACGCTLILRHQVLLGETEDMQDIAKAFWKLHRHLNGSP